MPDFHIPNDPEWQWAYDLILFGVGEEFPKADPTALRAMGEDLYRFSSHLLNGLGGTANLGNSLGSHLNGPAADAFSGFQGDITRGVPDGAQVALQLGHAAYQFALDSENTQYNIVIAAFTQVVEIAIALASGFGAAAVPALVKIGQEIVRTLISFLRLRLQNQLLHLVWEGVEEGLEEVWQSAAADLMQIAEGNRKQINYQNLLMAFAGGFFIGLGVSGTHWIAGKAYPKINKDVYSRETLSAFSETLFEGLFTMMVGGGGFNPFATFTSSIIGGMAHHYAEVFGKQFGPKVGPNDLRPPPRLDSHDRDPNTSPQNPDTTFPTPIAPPPVAPTPPPAPPPVTPVPGAPVPGAPVPGAPVPGAPDPGGSASTEAPAGADGPAPAPGVVAGNPMPATTGPAPADVTAPRPAASDPAATDAVATPSDAPPSPSPVAGTPPGTPITPTTPAPPPPSPVTGTPITPAGSPPAGTATPTPGTAGLPGATPQAPSAASGVDATADPGQTGSGTPALPGASTPPTAPAGPAETGAPDAPGGVPVGAGSPAPTGGVVTPPAATGASASGGDAAQTASPGAPAPTNPVDTPTGVSAAPPPTSGTAPNSPPTAAPPGTTAGPPADGTTRPAEGTTATPSSSGTPPITPPVAAGTPGLAPPSPATNAQVPAPVPPAPATPTTGINGNTPTSNTGGPSAPTQSGNPARPAEAPRPAPPTAVTPPSTAVTPTSTAASVDGLSPIEGPTAPDALPSQPRADQSVTAPAEPPGWTGGPTSTSDPRAGVDAEDTWTRDPTWDSDADADSETSSIWDDDPGRETDAIWDDDSDGVAPADRPAAAPVPAQSAPEPARAPVGAAPIGPSEPATHGEDRLRHEPGSPMGSPPTTVAAPTAAVVPAAGLSTDAVNVGADTQVTAELDQPGHRPPSSPSSAAATTVADAGVAGAGTRGPADPVRGTHIAPPAGTRVPAGLVLLDPDQTDNWTAAHDHPTRADHYVVFAHGAPDGIVVDGKLVTPEQLAALITSDPRSHGKHIVLAVCDIATGDYDLRLSDQPGITAVSAPELTAWTTPDGRILSAAISHTPAGHPRPDLTRPGTWRHSGKHPPASRITRNSVLPTPDPLTGNATSSPPAPRQHQTVGEVPGHSNPGEYVAWTLRREPALPTIPEVEEIELDERPPATTLRREPALPTIPEVEEIELDERLPAAEPATTAPASAADTDTASVVSPENDDESHPDDTDQPDDTDETDSAAATVATVPPIPDNPLRGFYRTRPDLLNEPDSVDDLAKLISGLDQSIRQAVRRHAAESSWISAILSHLPVDTEPVQRALRDELRSFFTTGGRSFFLRDGLHRWHRVTVQPRWDPADAQVIDQSEDKAKFDTRSDWSDGSKQASSTGSSGTISAGTMIPQRIGLGGGFSIDVSLSRPSETFQDSVKITDSHIVRSSSGSHLVSVPVDFEVVVTDPYARLTGPQPATPTTGDPVRVGLFLRGVDDIANAQPRQVTVPIDPARHTSMLVEHFTPVRILSAGIDLPSGVPPTDSWNDVAEDTLLRLQPTKTVPPGSIGADQGRRMLEESSMVGNLIPALESDGHPSTITSQHGNHALSAKITATVTELSATADIAKSWFRQQPGEVASTKLAQASRVGIGMSAIPARWSFGPAYVQGRLFGGFLRSITTSVSRGGASRIGTEFKDVPNVLVEARVRVTISTGLREVPLQRLPFGERGTVAPITLDMVVLGRLPASRLAQLQHDASPFDPSPTRWNAPPYAMTDARAVTSGLSAFNQLYLNVTGLVRRFPGGFLPRFGETDKVSWMGSSRAASERQANQDELDRVLTVPGLRQGRKSLLGGGLVGRLSRTKPVGTRHLVVHVIGRYTSPLDHRGTSRNEAVRTTDINSSEQKVTADGEWRTAMAVESGGIFRLVGDMGGAALVPAGAFEYRHRVGRQTSVQLAGTEGRLIGGTAHSEAFGTELEITVRVYAYARRPGFDSRSRIGIARVLQPRLPRPVTGETGTTMVRTTPEQVTAVGGRQFTRFRLTQARPVTVQLDAASVVATPLSLPVTLIPAPDPLGVSRRTQLEQSALREWVDAESTLNIDDWLAIEGLPGSTYVTKLATDALTAAQQYDNVQSRTRLRGVRGTDGLVEGMPVWAALLDRTGQFRQAHGLASMLNGVWLVDRLTTAEDGAATDIAIAAALTNARVVPTAHVPISTEPGSAGSIEVGTAKRVEKQFALRGLFSATLRRLGANTGGTSSGGVLGTARHEKLLYAGGKQKSQSVSGAIDRNRPGRNRTFVVIFDLRASATVEVTTEPARYRIVPKALRHGSWLHHYKSVQRHGTITNAVALRLPAPAVVSLGLLPPLAGDVGTMGAPWMPQSTPELRLPPGHGPGLGLYAVHHAPNLTERLTAALQAEAARTDDGRSTVRKVLDAIRSRGSNAAAKISASISDPGIGDTMLNRRRLLDLLSRDGIRQHWPAIVDGGLSVMHVKPARTSQHSREVRLVAETTGNPVFMGFVADHNDLDIKFTHAHGFAEARHRRHGQLTTAGVAGTGVSNQQGENIAVGVGDTVGRAAQEQNDRNISSSTVKSDLSSASGVKVRMALPVRFSLVVFDRGSPLESDLLVVEDRIVQDRWADDVRLPRTVPAVRPTTYQIHAPSSLGPGWRTLNGLPLPPRFGAEDLGRVAQLQNTVERLLSGTARRLRLPGYAGAHQIHQSLTPEILLPAVSAMLTPDGFELPPVTSAEIFGQQAQIVVRLVPEAASLQGVSSKVYREHAVQNAGEYSSGTSALVQNLRGLRAPLLGRGNVDDPYQPLESGGPGAFAGAAQAATESGSSTTGGFGNVKPGSRSALVDYFNRVEVDVTLSSSAFPSKTVTSAGQPTELLTVSLRMGLHDARTALDIPADGTPRPEAAERVAAFAELVAHEAELATAADAFVSASDRLDQARFDAYAAPEGSTDRATYEALLPGLIDTWNQAGQDWWQLAQRHYQLLDDFSSRFLGVAPEVDTEGAQRLADHVHRLGDNRIEEVPDSGDDPADDTPPTEAPPTISAAPTDTPPTERQPEPQPPEAEPSSQHTDHTAASTTKDTSAKTPPAGSPEVDPPSRDVPPTPAGPKPGLQTVSTPGDGRCQLYSIVGSAPQLVGSRLVAAGLDTPALRSWLANPDAVRAQLDGLTGPDAPRDPDGLVPQGSELGQAAEGLRQLVERYVQSVGRDGIPGTAIEAYRFNRNLRVRAEVDTLNRKALLDRLRSAGVTSLRNPDLVPATTLRDRYVEQRTADLVASGQDADSARSHAEQEVPLRPSADGPPRDLHDDSLSMRAMFDYLTAHGVTIPVQSLPDAVLRDQLSDHLIDPARPVSVVEFAVLTDAVRNWEKRWRNDIGEAFVGLLAAALDARIRIHASGHVHTLGRVDAPLIDVERQGDHYQAVAVPLLDETETQHREAEEILLAAPITPPDPSTDTEPSADGPPLQGPAHVPEPDYQLLRSADADHLAALHARVRQLVAARDDDRSRLPLEAYREIADAITTAIGAPPVRRISNDPQRRGAFDRQSWEVLLKTDLPVDQVMTSLVHELTHLEQMTVISQLVATTVGDATAANQVTSDPEVQAALWESRSPEDPRHAAMERTWTSIAANDMQVGEDQSLRVLRTSADARVSVARGMYQFSARVMQRLSRSDQALLDARFETTHPKYTALPMEMQAYLTQLRFESLGSVMDWSGTPVTRLEPPSGYQLDSLGPAGSHLRPAGAPDTRPDRLPHPDRPMLVISAADRSEAQRVLEDLTAELPPRVLVELVLASPITAGQAVHLAGLLGPDQLLAAAPALVTDTEGGHVDHLVPHSRLHTATALAFARYLTIHPTPQAPALLTPVHEMPYLGNGRWDMFQGWELVSIGHRVWIGPPGATPVIGDDDPRVVIGVPTQDTPWSAWQFGMWVSRTFATQEGAVDTDITRVHRPELQPPQLQLTGDLIHAVSPQDVQLARTVTGLPDPMAAYEYSHPHPFPPLDVVPGQDLSFTPYHLIDALLDVAALPGTESDPATAAAALTELAAQLDLTGPTALRNLLAAGFLAARAYGIGTFGPSRLAAAHRALRLLEPTGDLTAGPGAAADLVAWVAGMNIDQNAADLPVRLMRILDRTRDPAMGLGDLNTAEQQDDERIRLALDGLRQCDGGAWVTAGVDPQTPLAPVDGAIVLAYAAGPTLEPTPPGHPPTTDTNPMAVPLALLADQARHRIGDPPTPTVVVHLTPVTDHPITAVDFHRISGDLGELDNRLGWNVILREPVRPDGTEAQLVDENAGPPEVHEVATASAGDVTGT
ncbi:hypothetical protein HCA58_15975 [Micromonospora sp. HNM0581]|uniref:hypothetical protein n=1 Tax=Micromonospora sp. HNM0581 TaxID=2716341 RepID=UPI00146DDEBD|nr:hypothetical protein [Micromonospora sp. HNM0581]NLU79855.1 hypothetical protein [Micromonospora sp. HNM0581]